MPVHHLLIDPPSSSCLPDPYFPISTVVGLGLVLAWPIARTHLLFMFYVFKYWELNQQRTSRWKQLQMPKVFYAPCYLSTPWSELSFAYKTFLSVFLAGLVKRINMCFMACLLVRYRDIYYALISVWSISRTKMLLLSLLSMVITFKTADSLASLYVLH